MTTWHSQLPPHILAVVGLLSLLAASVFTFTGKVWVRFNGWVYRAKEPRTYWEEVAAYGVVGVALVASYLMR
jgi:hypothetical protein